MWSVDWRKNAKKKAAEAAARAEHADQDQIATQAHSDVRDRLADGYQPTEPVSRADSASRHSGGAAGYDDTSGDNSTDDSADRAGARPAGSPHGSAGAGSGSGSGSGGSGSGGSGSGFGGGSGSGSGGRRNGVSASDEVVTDDVVADAQAQAAAHDAANVKAAHAAWAKELRNIGGRNPLLHFDDRLRNRVDLSTTHPGGLAQFITGQKILLSALIRDDQALRHAKVAAARVTDKATELRNVRGLETTYLGVGIATWEFEGDSFCAPVLLRPLALRRYGRDFELKLKNGGFVNPDLVRALREQFGITVDARALLQLSQAEGVFKPQPVIDRLRYMAAGVADFSVQPRLVVSTFAGISHSMLSDLVDLDTPLLNAVAGSSESRALLRESYHPVDGVPLNKRTPETDRVLYDTDAEQDDVLTQINAGHSLTVRTLPGTGGTQTVVNAIGELVRSGKRVLVVSPRHATIEGISYRLARIGLPGLAVTPNGLRRSLVEAIRRNEQSHNRLSSEIDQALVRLRSVLLDYREALDKTDDRLGISPIQALRELVKLSLLADPPQTTVRLSEKALLSLAIDRSDIAQLLTEVARLGQFQYGPDDSPWYGVTFNTTEEARVAYARAVDVAETKLQRLITSAGELIEQTSLRPFETIAELGVYLRLLGGIRETLDRFNPEVYDRSLTEVIAAHAPRSASDTMSSANRRRLKKLAREYVRPGVQIDDMYSRLMQIQQQRVLWHRYCTVAGTRPEIPIGLEEVTTQFKALFDDIEALDKTLDVTVDEQPMRNLPLPELNSRIAALAEESEVLQNIQERTSIIERLREADLEALLADLSNRHVSADQVGPELEQAWWQTALESLLQHNKALLAANMPVIERLESDFRLVDDAHAGANGTVLAAQLADAWRVAILDSRAEAQALRDLLRAGTPSPEALFQVAPNLVNTLAPVWAMSPYEVPLMPRHLKFDAVLLVDAAAISTAEAAPALRRARQVVAFGDPVIQHPAPFEVAVLDPHASGPAKPRDKKAEPVSAVRTVADLPKPVKQADPSKLKSVYAALTDVLPELQLTHSYRAGGADLTHLVNTRFYDGKIKSLPWAGTFLGRSSLSYEFVRAGQGVVDHSTGAVESTDAEVERVIRLVLEHATERPNESLMVITASHKHAVRVWQSVLAAFAKRQDLRNFLLGEHAEPFVVVTLEEATALSRDRVIFSIGYGRTPHGRVLSNFGALSEPGGERLIAVAMTRARRAMTIVSCFRPEHLDQTRIEHGVAELSAVLAADSPEVLPEVLPEEQEAMVGELAERLTALGLTTALNYGGAIPLAASYGDRAVAVDIDFSGEDDSLRHTLRLRPAVLRRLGWHYQRVQSFDLFADPGEVALRIARIVGYEPNSVDAAGVGDPADSADAAANETRHVEVDRAAAGADETVPVDERVRKQYRAKAAAKAKQAGSNADTRASAEAEDAAAAGADADCC
ncbi:AAA family ATPase [Leucobacter sp. OH1287]|uniref:AAA family ATPase n=1 Tax=Leucobacter sp. OH1287 TaxID=2491049 RepID=UPI0018F518A4|nr:AAA family ATPase [Leucobacter sp. OH1287]